MNTTQKKAILSAHYPDECLMIGDHNLDILASRKVELQRTDFGSNADFYEVFKVVAEVAGFIDAVVDVYDILSKKGGSEPTPAKIREVVTEKTTYKTIDAQKQVVLIEHVVKTVKYG